MGVGLRHHLRRLLGGQCARQVDHRAASGGGTRGEAQGHRGACSEERQLHLAEIKRVDLFDPHVLAPKRHRSPRRVAARQQVQGAHRELQLFENLHQGFANGTGSADHGDFKGLGHGIASGITGERHFTGW